MTDNNVQLEVEHLTMRFGGLVAIDDHWPERGREDHGL